MVTSLEKRHVRIALDIDDVRLLQLPWETLYLADIRVFVAQTHRYSLVRIVPDAVEVVPRSLESQLRILAVVASPNDAPLPSVDQEGEMLRSTLAQAHTEGYVKLRILKDASVELVMRELRILQPHIFHFVGHGVVYENKGHLVFVDEHGGAQKVTAEHVGVILQDYPIILAVLNGCETGMGGGEAMMNGVAQALVRQGVPAAVATTRDIQDAAALGFTREFYRALVDGYPIEAAIVEARKSLNLKNWDWSAYALFSGAIDLDPIRFVRQEPDHGHLR